MDHGLWSMVLSPVDSLKGRRENRGGPFSLMAKIVVEHQFASKSLGGALALFLSTTLIPSPIWHNSKLQTPPTAPRHHALLIGVTRYANLDKRFQLAGPLNDVTLLRQTLEERFGFPRQAIVELSESTMAVGRPTRANIASEFQRLAERVSPGDHVTVLFGGHGSQQPDDDPVGSDENDGLDEIILPADAARWDGKAGRVKNAITDDEIRAWLIAIRNRGAFVFIIFDACQSTTLTRGTVEAARRIPVSDLIPAEVLDNVARKARVPGPTPESNVLGLPSSTAGIAALYAAQTTESTPEKRLPNESGAVHGLFTYTIVELLQQTASSLTYRDLIERVTDRYRAIGRLGPTPGFEGSGMDEPVFGRGTTTRSLRLLIGEEREGMVVVRAGSIQGLTTGTILQVLPPAEAKDLDAITGYLQIADVRATSAFARPIPFRDTPARDRARFVPNSRCEVVFFDYGDLTLKVAPETSLQRRAGDEINSILNRLPELTRGLAAAVPSAFAADWIVRQVGDEVVLAPTSGWSIGAEQSALPDSQSAPFRLGKLGSTGFAESLSTALTRIARVTGLLRLSSVVPTKAPAVDIEIEMITHEHHPPEDTSNVSAASHHRRVHRGDEVAFRIRNTGSRTADLTLFFVDAQYGITMLFPRRDAESDARLKQGAEITTERFQVTDDTLGWEQVVAVAVSASDPRVDLGYLEQSSLESSLARGRVVRTPLQKLLDTAVFGAGTVRGLASDDVTMHTMKVIAWRTQRQ